MSEFVKELIINLFIATVCISIVLYGASKVEPYFKKPLIVFLSMAVIVFFGMLPWGLAEYFVQPVFLVLYPIFALVLYLIPSPTMGG